MSFDTFINPDELLCSVSRYQLNRQEGRIIIDCFKIIVGEGRAPFIAIPYLTSLGNIEERFYGYGKTEEEALKDCLMKIKNHKYEDIVGIEHS